MYDIRQEICVIFSFKSIVNWQEESIFLNEGINSR